MKRLVIVLPGILPREVQASKHLASAGKVQAAFGQGLTPLVLSNSIRMKFIVPPINQACLLHPFAALITAFNECRDFFHLIPDNKGY